MNESKATLYCIAIIILLSFTNLSFAEERVLSNQTGATSLPDHITLTWTDNTSSTQTISWRTEISVTQSQVQYYEGEAIREFNEKDSIVSGENSLFRSDVGDMKIHSVTLKNLKSNTKYTYRAGNGKIWSEKHTFITGIDENEKFKFLIFGDSQSGNPEKAEYGNWKKSLENAYSLNKDAKFFIVTGDLVEVGQYYIHWNKWFEAAAGVMAELPIVPVQGNHETFNHVDEKRGKPEYWLAQFDLPKNGADKLKEETYSFDYGNVHFSILDSQFEEEMEMSGDILTPQKEWLENDLKASTKLWKIVLIHKPFYFNGAIKPNELLRKTLQPVIDKYHADLVFSGHDHGVSRTYPINNNKFKNDTNEGTVYYMDGRSGDKTYSDLFNKGWNEFFFDPKEKPNFLTVEVDKAKLTVKVFEQDGRLIDSYFIDKKNNSNNYKTVLPVKTTETKLLVNGFYANGIDAASSPKLIDNKWYIPMKNFSKIVEGSAKIIPDGKVRLNISDIKVTFTQNETTVTIDGKKKSVPDAVKVEGENIFVSADDVKILFNYGIEYDDENNILFLTKE